MINHMNKHINVLSLETVQGLEKTEHGLRKTPSAKDLQSIEMVEHKMSRKPTLRELLKIETKEHAKKKNEEEDDDDDEEEYAKDHYCGMGPMVIRSGSK